MEFRSKLGHPLWHSFWDWSFSLGSFLASFLLGVAFGNLVRGIPVGADGEFAGTFISLLNPYALFFGVASVGLLAFHGASYLVLKTEGPLKNRMQAVGTRGRIGSSLLIAGLVGWGWDAAPLLHDSWNTRPFLFLLPIAAILLGVSGGSRKNPLRGFLASCGQILLTLAFFFAVLYPNLVYSFPFPENSLTLQNAASSAMTLKIMAVIAGLGLPLILFYTAWVYRVFAGPSRSEY